MKRYESFMQKYGEAACQVQVEGTCLCFKSLIGALAQPYLNGTAELSAGFENTSAMHSAHLLPALRLSQLVHLFRGQTLSQIMAPLSIQNFGWDPCIQPDDYEQMDAEMPEA
ncbi:hypothetical protein A6R68_05331 [Neotoma lepida]|uniref:Uncharacterized protein n=1 Tax=Neotoma lepida TaxID=56216 RepID=A0A1A6GIP1_NEOLE|nr:hypothetical protein A6R68_05331 [Neotoma lepida]